MFRDEQDTIHDQEGALVDQESHSGRCPSCSYLEEEPSDYDIGGNSIFTCGNCGTLFAHPPGQAPIIVDSHGF